MTTTENTARNTTRLSLQPFRGLRYDPDRVSSLAAVTSPPYDVVIRPEGVQHLQTSDPHNVVRLILPSGTDPDDRHQRAARTLHAWRRDGVLVPDPEPALYVYEQHADGELQRGVIGALGLGSSVLPHENVMQSVVTDRADLMRATAANLEPLLLAYRGRPDGPTHRTLDHVTEHTAPLFTTTTEDGVRHRLWSVTDPDVIAAVTTELAGHQALIADGHHRWATYQQLRQEHLSPSAWDLGLVLLVDSARYPLRVRAIHRVLHHLPVADAVAAAGGVFRTHRIPGPLDRALTALAEANTAGNAFVLAGDGHYHLLTSPDPAALDATVPTGPPAAWRRLDATVLHRLLLDRVWQIPDSPEAVGYLHHAAAAEQQAARLGGTVVLMHPVEESTVRGLAEQGVMMPHKSTSFGPKPATGLVLRSLDLD